MKIVVNNTKKKSDIQQWADSLRAKWEKRDERKSNHQNKIYETEIKHRNSLR